MRADELQKLHGVSGRCRFFELNGLTAVTISSRESDCDVVLQGAHVTRFESAGEHPLLFLSAKSQFTPGKAIRGGVPVIFPWFGAHATDPSKPSHGFARTSLWSFDSVDTSQSDVTELVLRLESSAETLSLWPHRFTCIYRISVGEDLTMSLEVRNESDAEMAFEEALHTYVAVDDVRRVSVHGLERTTYIDKTDGMNRKTTGAEPLVITGETDSVFLDTVSTCVVEDPGLGRGVRVEKSGSKSTVVWNPWIDKARSFSDFGDDEWISMICVETANAGGNAVRLGPGASHRLTARVQASPLR